MQQELQEDYQVHLNIVVNGFKTSGITTVGVLTAISIGIGTDSANANLQIHNAVSIFINRNW